VSDPQTKLRIDKWLWHARFFKTRALAAKVAASGQVRANGTRVAKASFAVSPGVVLTFPQASLVRVVRVRDLGQRRGPAPEAQLLYEDLDPPAPRSATGEADDKIGVPGDRAAGPHAEAGGRPTKKDRRAFEKSQRRGAI